MKQFDFQYNTTKGGINVQFRLTYDNNTPVISNINIHSSYGTGLPTHSEIRVHNGERKFYIEYSVIEEGESQKRYEYISTELAKELINRIDTLVQEEVDKQKV